MREQFEKYRDRYNIFKAEDRILLGVSGGIDSVVMLDLFLAGKNNIAVAHCNFRLRGAESDGDEKFVDDVCSKKGLKLYKKRFATVDYASEKGVSIQMAARELRFEWMLEILENEKYDLLALGHNLNDSIETIIINLTRGTGLNGLTGMPCRSGKIIRPLLFATREMIKEYALERKLKYREDSSNARTKYTRNKIRHRIIPVLEEINPSILYSMDETAEYLKSAYVIYEQAVDARKAEIIDFDGKYENIKIAEIDKLKPAETWIYEIFKTWGFGKQQVSDITRLIKGDTGKQVISDSHILTKDRQRIIISERKNDVDKPVSFNSPSDLGKSRFIKKIGIMPVEKISFSNNPRIAYIDADLISYPLKIRKWKEGDYFYPLGMKGRKKVSDLLIDMKIPLPEKENIHILETDGKIIWVMGLRIDDRFKISSSTTEAIMFEMI